jgi:hypothetical protein
MSEHKVGIEWFRQEFCNDCSGSDKDGFCDEDIRLCMEAEKVRQLIRIEHQVV